MPRTRLAAAGSAVVVALLVFASTASGHDDEHWTAPATIPKDNPKRGMVYDGLKVASSDGACAGLLKVVGEPSTCTHGPDPAPSGMDVGDRQSIPELTAEAKEAGAGGTGGGGTPQAGSIACVGTGSDGDRVVAIYAHAQNVPSRFAQVQPLMKSWAEDASSVFDASAAKTGGSRQIRFLTDSGSPGCNLRTFEVPLSNTGDDSFNNTVNEIRAWDEDGQGHGRPDRRYMVWVDSNIYCGIAQIQNDSHKIQNNLNNGVNTVPGMVARIDNGCWGDLNQSTNSISVEAHELTHNLGGVQLDAPHSSGGWHCTDESDTMCYSDTPNHPVMQQLCPANQETLLDCNGDDYFNTNPLFGNYLFNHWNVADSAFLTDGNPPGPFNNNFANAQGIAGRTFSTTSATSVNATKQSGEPDHAGNAGGKSIWYSWTAPFSKPVTISTAGSDFNTLLGVYTGTAVNALTPVAGGSNDDENNPSVLTSKVTFTAQAGTIYRIAVDGSGGASGSVHLSLAQDPPPVPPNNDFAAAQLLTGGDASRSGDYNDQANKETGEPNHAGNAGGASIWYRWDAPTNGLVKIDTAGSSFDTTLGVYEGSAVNALSQVASNDDTDLDAQVHTSRVAFYPKAGQTYRIAVDGFKFGSNSAEVGTVSLTLHQGAPVASNPTPPSTNTPSEPSASPTTSTPRHQLVCKKKKKKRHGKKPKKKCRIVSV